MRKIALASAVLVSFLAVTQQAQAICSLRKVGNHYVAHCEQLGPGH